MTVMELLLELQCIVLQVAQCDYGIVGSYYTGLR